MNPYRLHHVDTWIDDYQSTIKLLAEGYGFPSKTFRTELRSFGAWAAYSVLGDPDYSTTDFCMMGTSDLPGIDRTRVDYAYLVESASLPPLRPGRFHSTTITVPDLAPYLERLDRNGVRYRLDQPAEDLPAVRLWIGWGSDKSSPWYQGDSDTGLKLEFFAPHDMSYRYTLEAAKDEPGIAKSAPDLCGVEAKTLLVRDLQGATAALERNFDWTPGSTWSKNGISFAEYGFDDPGSAVIQLVSPSDAESPLGRVLGEWDYAPSVIRVACSDLDAREEALRRAGLNPQRGAASDGSDRDAMLVPSTIAGPGLFEFCEPKR